MVNSFIFTCLIQQKYTNQLHKNHYKDLAIHKQYMNTSKDTITTYCLDKKVINSSTKCLISVKIAILTPCIILPLLVNVWLIFGLRKHINWLCLHFQRFLLVWKMRVIACSVWACSFVCSWQLLCFWTSNRSIPTYLPWLSWDLISYSWVSWLWHGHTQH